MVSLIASMITTTQDFPAHQVTLMQTGLANRSLHTSLLSFPFRRQGKWRERATHTVTLMSAASTENGIRPIAQDLIMHTLHNVGTLHIFGGCPTSAWPHDHDLAWWT
jgi:hypothetical protein